MSSPPPRAEPRYLVVFTGRSELRCLRWLKPGFRHCFLVIDDGRHWLVYDPLSHRTELRLVPAQPGVDLAAWFAAHGCRAVAAVPRAPARRLAPPLPFTCVEAVKRALGLRSWRILTPWQLYRALTRGSAAALDNDPLKD